MNKLDVIECTELCENACEDTVYHLQPIDRGNYYNERIDRNIGWITPAEQVFLKTRCIGIAGCGGMGGRNGEAFIRTGIGRVHISDAECFDASNTNRQAGATRNTIGVSKALATARLLREIADDTTLVVYPQGITEETVDHFLDGCHVVCDEIEFWAIGSRILLHQRARERGIPIFNCNTVGFGTHLFLFTPDGAPIEEVLECDYKQAKKLQERIQSKTATAEEVGFVMERVIDGLVPRLHGYTTEDSCFNDLALVRTRLFKEGKASIIATNPIMASGFLADHALFHLLKNSSAKRAIVRPPKSPGYLYFDAATFETEIIS